MMTSVDGGGGLNGKIRWIRIASGAPTKKDARRHQDELDIGLSLSLPSRSATRMMTDQVGYAASPPLTCCIAQIAACVRFRTPIFRRIVFK